MARSFAPLQTRRLRIRPFGEEHLTQAYVSWLNDPEVTRYSEQRHKTHTMESCTAYLRQFAGAPHHFLAIEAHEPELGHIGNMTVTVDPANEHADIAILIGATQAWGQGYGFEAWSAVLNALLAREGLRKVTAGTVEPNRAMLAIMRKSGMVEDGRRKQHLLADGAPADVIHFASFADSSK